MVARVLLPLPLLIIIASIHPVQSYYLNFYGNFFICFDLQLKIMV